MSPARLLPSPVCARRQIVRAAAALLLLAGCKRRLPSGAARAEWNVAYGHHPSTRLDVFWPAAPPRRPLPAVLVFHGGGWREGTRDDVLARLCRPYLDHGFLVANAGYRLAAEAHAPAAVIDALQAAAWLSRSAPALGADPLRLVATGESAGAHLAMMASMAPPSAGFGTSPRFAAVVSFSGISDVSALLEGPGAQDFASEWCGPSPDAKEIARKVSPLSWIRPGLPPLLAVHAAGDPVVPYRQAAALVAALRAAGNSAELITIQSSAHGFSAPDLDNAYRRVFPFLHALAPSRAASTPEPL